LFLKKLRGEFLKRAAKIWKKVKCEVKLVSERPAERRSRRKQRLEPRKVGHAFRRIWVNREDKYFRWIRVGEYFKELRQEQEYEWQGKIADKIMKKAAYNKIINY